MVTSEERELAEYKVGYWPARHAESQCTVSDKEAGECKGIRQQKIPDHQLAITRLERCCAALPTAIGCAVVISVLFV